MTTLLTAGAAQAAALRDRGDSVLAALDDVRRPRPVALRLLDGFLAGDHDVGRLIDLIEADPAPRTLLQPLLRDGGAGAGLHGADARGVVRACGYDHAIRTLLSCFLFEPFRADEGDASARRTATSRFNKISAAGRAEALETTVAGRCLDDLSTRAQRVARAAELVALRAFKAAPVSTGFRPLPQGRGSERPPAHLSACVHAQADERGSEGYGHSSDVSNDFSLSDQTPGRVAFVTGLLCDVGQWAMVALWPKSFAVVQSRIRRSHTAALQAERDVFGVDHCTIGERIVRDWCLPDVIVAAVRHHHDHPDTLPASGQATWLSDIVALADALDRERIGRVDSTDPALHWVARRLGLDDTTIGEIEKSLGTPPETAGHERAGERSAPSGLPARGADALNTVAPTRAAVAVVTDAVDGFIEAVRGGGRQATPGDVGRAAADAVGRIASAHRAVTCVRNGPRSPVILGCSTPKGAVDCVGRTGVPVSSEAGAWFDRLEDRPTGLLPVPARGGAIWETCYGRPALRPLWALPFTAPADDVRGVVLVEEPVDGGPPRVADPTDVVRLSSIIGATFGQVFARVACERRIDELVWACGQQGRAPRDGGAAAASLVAAVAAGAAHELNNPLSVVSGRAQMLLSTCSDPPTVTALRKICDQARGASQIVSELLTATKPDRPQPQCHRLGALFGPLWQHWCERLGLRDGRLTARVADGDATLYADARHVEQMLDALIDNAARAIDPESGRIFINSPSRASDETARIVVEDDGVGMTRDVLAGAMTPFFSDRPAGRGRGLGLWRAHRLAEVNGGRISIASKPGAGTTVTVALPARPPV